MRIASRNFHVVLIDSFVEKKWHRHSDPRCMLVSVVTSAAPHGGTRDEFRRSCYREREPLDCVDSVQIALGPLLVKREERGPVEGKHGEGSHEGIC
jgi:hypothetical protein